MANLLDETQGPVNDNGRDVHVIDRQLPVTITFRSTLFEIALWVTLPLLTLIYVLAMGDQLADPTTVAIGGCVAGVLPGVVFIFMKISARNYFLKLEQRIQAEASNIDNYLEQRVQILQNVVGLVNRAIDLDKDVMKAVAALRGGKVNEANRSDVNSQISSVIAPGLEELAAGHLAGLCRRGERYACGVSLSCSHYHLGRPREEVGVPLGRRRVGALLPVAGN